MPSRASWTQSVAEVRGPQPAPEDGERKTVGETPRRSLTDGLEDPRLEADLMYPLPRTPYLTPERRDDMAKFTPGDVARLKSGGPPMTVVKVNPDGSLHCQWFDKDGKKRVVSEADFSELVLETSQPARISVG